MTLFEIDGDISIARSFDAAELAGLPDQIVERSLLLGGRDIGGVRLATIVAALGVKSWARYATLRASDGFVANLPIAALKDCLLVYRIGDGPLPSELGGPVRVLTRGLDRCTNVRGLIRVTFAVAAAATAPCHHRARMLA
jgi:DMSO/TMAO reductase YedYZ molybdopterin-dependent catalytic subunit